MVSLNPDSMHVICNLIFTHASEEDRQYVDILWDSNSQLPVFNVVESSSAMKGFYEIDMPDNDNYTLKDVIEKVGIDYNTINVRLYDGPLDTMNYYQFNTQVNGNEILELPFFCIDYLHAELITNDWLKQNPPKGRAQVDYLVLKKKVISTQLPEWVLKHHPWYQNAEKEFQTLFEIDV
jgi:hypothetical protein